MQSFVGKFLTVAANKKIVEKCVLYTNIISYCILFANDFKTLIYMKLSDWT